MMQCNRRRKSRFDGLKALEDCREVSVQQQELFAGSAITKLKSRLLGRGKPGK